VALSTAVDKPTVFDGTVFDGSDQSDQSDETNGA